MVEIREIETLSEGHYPLRKVTFEQVRGDGSRQTLEREVYCIQPSAAVLLYQPTSGTVLLTRQLRIPALLNGEPPGMVEICAGNVEENDTPEETVRKEAEQETGYRVHRLNRLFALYMSPGATTEKLHFFLAEYGERVGKGGGERGEGEDIELLELPLTEAWQMVESGEIVDAKTVLLLQHARLAGV